MVAMRNESDPFPRRRKKQQFLPRQQSTYFPHRFLCVRARACVFASTTASLVIVSKRADHKSDLGKNIQEILQQKRIEKHPVLLAVTKQAVSVLLGSPSSRMVLPGPKDTHTHSNHESGS